MFLNPYVQLNLADVLIPNCRSTDSASACCCLHKSTLLYFYKANITFEKAQIFDINAADLKDIVEVDLCPVVKIHQFITSGCQAHNQILDIVNSTVYISNSSFGNARARGLSIDNSNATVSDTAFENLACSETQFGGALWVKYSRDNSLHIQASNFSNNNANGTKGGAMYLECATCQFENVRLVENTSGGHGGAVIIDQSGAMSHFTTACLPTTLQGILELYMHSLAWRVC